MNQAYQICNQCIMDTTDSTIAFDENGICNHCRNYSKLADKILVYGKRGEDELNEIIQKIKNERQNKDYDCVVGLSGGVDSSFVAYKVVELGLKPLAIHVDGGWNSELAQSNIENLVKKLNIDLITKVINWNEMRDLQLSFLKSGVANCDIPQDHAFVASVYKEAVHQKISYLISGYNFNSEGVFAPLWEHRFKDLTYLKSIHKKFGKIKLKTYPTMNFFEFSYFYPYFKKMRDIRILNYLDYNKTKAKQILKEKIDWRDYGEKHYESRFTRFFQAYYLPKKFGFDKRKPHYSSLILAGHMTRDEALALMKEPLYSEENLREDLKYVSNKLEVSLQDLNQFINQPNSQILNYPTNDWLVKLKLNLDKIFGL